MNDCVTHEELTVLPSEQFGCKLEFNCNYGGIFDDCSINTEFCFNEDNTLKLLSVLNQVFPEVKEFGKLIDFHLEQKDC